MEQQPSSPFLCDWREHRFRKDGRCFCGAFTYKGGVLTENSLDPLPDSDAAQEAS